MNFLGVLLTVVFGLWLLYMLLRKTDEERRNREREREVQRPERPSAPPPKKKMPPADIDRFLEEVNRRRRQQADRPRPIAEAKHVSASGGTVKRVVKPVPAARVAQPVAVVETVVPVAEATPTNLVWPEARKSPAPAAGFAFPAAPTRPPSVALQEVAALLRSPNTLRNAVILREIFDGPRCRRPAKTAAASCNGEART